MDTEEQVDVKVPPEAGKWIGKKLGGYDLVEYLREDLVSLFYLGKPEGNRVKEEVEVKVLKKEYKNNTGIVGQFLNEANILNEFGGKEKEKQNLFTILDSKIINHPRISQGHLI